MRARILAAAVAFAFAFAPLAADAAPSAKEKAQAKGLVSDGRAAAKAGRYADAASAFSSAIAIDPSPQLKLDLGRAYVQLGKLVEAKASLKSSIDDAANSKNDKKIGDAAKKALDDVESRIPSITVAIAGADPAEAHTTIDAKPVDAGSDVPLDPGSHVVASDADGFDHAEKTVTLAEGEHQKVRLKLAKTGPAAAATKDDSSGGSSLPAYVALGVGVVGVGVGAVFGIMALNDKSAADKDCVGTSCSAAAQSSINSSLTEGNVSTVAFIVGGVGLATGAILLIVKPGSKKAEKSDAASIEPWIGAGRAGFSGRF